MVTKPLSAPRRASTGFRVIRTMWAKSYFGQDLRLRAVLWNESDGLGQLTRRLDVHCWHYEVVRRSTRRKNNGTGNSNVSRNGHTMMIHY